MLAQRGCGKVQSLRFWRTATLMTFAFGMQFMCLRFGHTATVVLDVCAFVLTLTDTVTVDWLVDRCNESIDAHLSEAEHLIIFDRDGRCLGREERALLRRTKLFDSNAASWFPGLRVLHDYPTVLRELFCARVESIFRKGEYWSAFLISSATFASFLLLGVIESSVSTRPLIERVQDYLLPMTVVSYAAFIRGWSNFKAHQTFRDLHARAGSLLDEWQYRMLSAKSMLDASRQMSKDVGDLWTRIRSARCSSPPVAEFIWRITRHAHNAECKALALRIAAISDARFS